MSYRYVVPILSKEQHLVVEDLRTGDKFAIPLSRFKLEPASGVYRERELVAEHVGFKVRIPIVMRHDMDGCIESAMVDLKTAIRLLETENPLKSKKVVDGRLVEDEPV